MKMLLNRNLRLKLESRYLFRRLTTSSSRRIEDEGDWCYSTEWWGNDDDNTIFSSLSDYGNGVVSVVSSHCSRPNKSQWYKTENWLSQRYAELYPKGEQNGRFRVLGYEWRRLRFNDVTRQSTAKVMLAYKESDLCSVFIKQEPHCLAVPYLKSMVSAGLASISCNYDLLSCVYGTNTLKVLCIGHGGGSLPLFLASKIPGAIIDIVEIDPVVIIASTQAMGFPAYSTMNKSGNRSHTKPDLIDEVLWKGVHERLHLYEADAEHFMTKNTTIYDMVFVDAYDGEDIFPHKLWDPDSLFLKALSEWLHPEHGTVVVNLHADDNDIDDSEECLLPMGKYVSQVCKAYKKVILDDFESKCGLAFTVNAPWVCNTSLVVSRGFKNSARDFVLNDLFSKSLKVENALNVPFSCLQYIKRGLTFVE